MRVAYIRRVIFSSRMDGAHRGAGTISPRFHLHSYTCTRREPGTESFPLSFSPALPCASQTIRGQVLLRPCRADRMLPGFLRVQSGPGIRVVGCTGMHAVGWPGAFLRRCRVSYSPCPERVRNERGREDERGSRRWKERRSGELGSRTRPQAQSPNKSFCLFAEAIEFAREERTASRETRSWLPPVTAAPCSRYPDAAPLHRGIANFFLAAAEEENSLRRGA